MGFWDQFDDDDDEFEEAEVEEESEEEGFESDDSEVLARVERVFRSERALIRASEDIAALRAMRAAYEEQLTDGTLAGIGAVRGNDLVELIDERLTDLRATRRAEQRR